MVSEASNASEAEPSRTASRVSGKPVPGFCDHEVHRHHVKVFAGHYASSMCASQRGELSLLAPSGGLANKSRLDLACKQKLLEIIDPTAMLRELLRSQNASPRREEETSE